MKSRILVIVVLIYLIVSGCAGNDGSIGGSGLIEADEITVSAETSGRIDSVFFDDGDLVSPGDTLLVIDPSRLELQRASLEAGRSVAQSNLTASRIAAEQADSRLAYAGTELTRIEKLVASGTSSKQQLDRLQFERDQAELAARTARAQAATVRAEIDRIASEINRIDRQLRDCFPVSPIQGTVTERFADAGELITPGQSIARLANLEDMRVKIYLPAGDFAGVKIGDRAKISTESGGQEYEGTVIWTSPEAEFTPKNVQTAESRAGLVYAVKVRIPNTDRLLKIGMPVYVSLESE